MSRKLLFLISFFLITFIGLQANPVHKIKTAQGTTVGVEACADGIYRIHISPRKDFSESLMERYGLLNTDWSAAGEIVSDKGGTWTLTTPGYRLTVNKKTGRVEAKGRVLPLDMLAGETCWFMLR